MKFEISSLTHPLVKHLVKVKTSREYRQTHRSILTLGQKLIREIIPDTHLKVILIEKGFTLNFDPPSNTPIYEVPYSLLKKISDLSHPEPILAEVEMPPFADLQSPRFILVLDGVADPGNLGTLIRSALALNWEGVYLTPNCTDPFNDKAIRAAKGATFRLPIASGSWEELEKIMAAKKGKIYLATVDGNPFQQEHYSAPLALILSNESCGPSEYAKKLATPISIVMSPKMESLNVAAAGAILMHYLGPK